VVCFEIANSEERARLAREGMRLLLTTRHVQPDRKDNDSTNEPNRDE
jgi:hypothetical protein